MSESSNEPQKAETQVAAAQVYDAAQIDKLEGLDAVRKRPGMYIGDPDERGLHHCVFEVLDNSIDEHLAGYCSRIKVAIHVDGSVSIADNGRGIPVDMHQKFGMPAVELVLTNLHAGGKFGQGAYKYSGGLHGVGAKCVNALSDWFKAEIMRNGKVHLIGFERGKTTIPLHVIGDVDPGKTGTMITFFPDATIFVDTIEFKFDRLATRLRELAFLNPGLTIDLEDERPESAKKATFYYQKGIEEFVAQLGENKTLIHDEPVILHGKRAIDLDYDGKKTTDDVFADVVFQYNDSYNDQILCFANSIPNGDGGTHLTGFRTALTRGINQYAKVNKILKDKDPALTGDDVREGLIAIISVKMPNPRFSSQTKDKLVNSGSILVGDKGILYSPNDYGASFRITAPDGSPMEVAKVAQVLPRNGKGDQGMKDEWARAIKENKPEIAMSNFDYAGVLTEAVLLGNVAMRAGKKILWDGNAMRITNLPEANAFLHFEYRKGWTL